MSSFPGLISGYPELAVDRFTGPCLRAQYFLLSHLHQDHMDGLNSEALLAALAALPGRRLLLSRQSAALLAGWPRYRRLQPHLCPLEVGEPCQLTDRLVVTPLPAAHCPGSVMFLLEAGEGGTVLYTGDFRLDREQLADFPALHRSCGRPKPIDLLYADTTFCVPERRDLPSRSRSAESVVRLVTDWLRRGPDHRANLECKARYGYEHVFRRLHEATGQRVHVDDYKYRLYERLPDIARCLTPHASDTRLHSCWPGAPCLRGDAPLRWLTLSTLYFFYNQSVDRLEYPLGGERYRVLYSFHASLQQVQEMVAYLRPGRVVPCVVPAGGSIESVVALLRCGEAEAEPDGERTPLLPPLSGGLADSNGQSKRTLLSPSPPAEGGRDQNGLFFDLLPADLKRPRVQPDSPERARVQLESPALLRVQPESPARLRVQPESPVRFRVQQEPRGPLRVQQQPPGYPRVQQQPSGHPRVQQQPPGHPRVQEEPPGHPRVQREPPERLVIAVPPVNNGDSRPVWKCPFDSD